MKRMTFVQAMKDYFGLRPEQTPTGFMHEMKALTSEDREWFKANLPKVGYEIIVA